MQLHASVDNDLSMMAGHPRLFLINSTTIAIAGTCSSRHGKEPNPIEHQGLGIERAAGDRETNYREAQAFAFGEQGGESRESRHPRPAQNSIHRGCKGNTHLELSATRRVPLGGRGSSHSCGGGGSQPRPLLPPRQRVLGLQAETLQSIMSMGHSPAWRNGDAGHQDSPRARVEGKEYAGGPGWQCVLWSLGQTRRPWVRRASPADGRVPVSRDSRSPPTHARTACWLSLSTRACPKTTGRVSSHTMFPLRKQGAPRVIHQNEMKVIHIDDSDPSRKVGKKIKTPKRRIEPGKVSSVVAPNEGSRHLSMGGSDRSWKPLDHPGSCQVCPMNGI